MLRSIIARICSSSIDSLAINASYCTGPTPKFTDLNKVKLVGTIVSDSFSLPEKGQVFRMKTHIRGMNASIQDVIYNGRKDYNIGDRIILTGHLKTRLIEIESGKKKSAISIVAHKMFELEKSKENDDASSSSDSFDDENVFNDVNRIEITGNVVKDIYESGNFSLLNIATHYNQVFEGVRKTDFHCIQIIDEKLRTFIKNNIQMRDRVLINGMLSRQTHIMADGKKKFSGFIVAKNVWKLHQRVPNANITSNESE